MTIDHRVLADIEQAGLRAGLEHLHVYECGCENRTVDGALLDPNRWYLCQFHNGFDAAVTMLSVRPDDEVVES